MYPIPGPDDGEFDVATWIARMTADEHLAEQVAQALRSNPRVRGTRLEITVQNGVVILEGTLDSTDAREAARVTAWTIPGVHDVCDALAAS
ncbi:BON domain-containing protein [Actinoplanes sp. TRM 88003]|uniref:BON domain-containing protein n=1 Tax=Paractinoplanes aksuensis TaxID=2939490 RepID=A0ABT1DMH0_9ACTN|nr:BON domain-containing protein [Actinoplanes aksuensis]MCO8271708.1 BON domain-containing protein [Actinoplanes aksuensis]